MPLNLKAINCELQNPEAFKSITLSHNLPTLNLNQRISKAKQIYQDNLKLYNKILNTKSSIPSKQQLSKENLLKRQLSNRISAFDKETFRIKPKCQTQAGVSPAKKEIFETIVAIKPKKDPLIEREKMRLNLKYLHRQMNHNSSKKLVAVKLKEEKVDIPHQIEEQS